MKFMFCSLLVFSFLQFSYGQEKDTAVTHVQELTEVRYHSNFDAHYRSTLNKLRRTYPLALRAKEVIDSLDMELEGIDKKRLRKKVSKERKKELEDELQFLIKDLYVSEGKMLFKLIHRETGMTVTDILEKYRGKVYAKTVKATFSLYGHDTSSEFDPNGKEWLADMILKDIEAGHKIINLNVQPVSKVQYKDNMKEYRSQMKKRRKEGRQERRAERKAKRNNQDLANE